MPIERIAKRGNINIFQIRGTDLENIRDQYLDFEQSSKYAIEPLSHTSELAASILWAKGKTYISRQSLGIRFLVTETVIDYPWNEEHFTSVILDTLEGCINTEL